MHIDFHDNTNSVPADFIDLLQRLLEFAGKEKVFLVKQKCQSTLLITVKFKN